MKKRSDMHRKMRDRNIAVLVAILAFVVLIVALTMVKLGGGG